MEVSAVNRGRQHAGHLPRLTGAWGGRNINCDRFARIHDRGALVENHTEDQPVLNYIQRLVEEEHRLYGQGRLPKADRKRLEKIHVELDQCWDLLRQRRALRDVGVDPNEAEVRPPQIVENYEQ